MGIATTEEKIKDLTKATIRCISGCDEEAGSCVFTGNPHQRVLLPKHINFFYFF
jgi:prolyl-tRNA synthetase